MLGANKPRIAPVGRPGNLMSESRIVRAPPTGDKLADFVSNMQQIARIANGISLQAGLIEGSMPVEDVIAELLHMGSMKPSELMAVNPAVVKQLINDMKTAQGKLIKSQTVTSSEDSFLKIASAMTSDVDMTAFKNLVGRKEYETHLDNVIKSKLNSTDLQPFFLHANIVNYHLAKVKDMQSDINATLAASEVNELTNLHQGLVQLEKSFADAKFQQLLSLVADLEQMIDKSSFVELLLEENKVRNAQYTWIGTNDPTFANVTANFQVFEKLSNSFGKQSEVLSKLHSFVETRQSGRQSGAQYTGGFPDGVKDLEGLSADIDDKWFQQVVGGQTMSADFKKGLLPLEGFKVDGRNVENAWQLAGAKIGSAETVVGQQARIASQATNAVSISTKMVPFSNCSKQFQSNVKVYLSSINQDIDSIRQFDRYGYLLGNIKRFGQSAVFSVIKKATSFTGLSTPQEKANATPDLVRKLKAMPEVNTTLIQVKDYSWALRNADYLIRTLPSTHQNIKSALLAIDGYHSQVVNSNFGDWKDCLKKSLGSDGEVVSTMIEAIRKLRAMGKTQEISEAEGSLVAFLNSAHLLKSVKSSAESMKNVKTLESKTMSLLKKDVSSRLGWAAQGLKEIQKANENRKKLGVFSRYVSVIDRSAEKYQYSLTLEEYKSLKKVIPLEKSLTAMFKDIDEFKPSIDKLVGTDLKSYKPVLDAAAKIRGVKVDAKKLKKAVESLALMDPSQKSEYGNVTASLDTLGQLDLEFSSFKMGGASGAIDELDAFFQSWPKSLEETKKEALEKENSGSWTLLIIGGILLVALLIGLVVGAVFLIKKSKKEKLKKKKEAEEKSGGPQTDTKPNEPESPTSPVQKGSASAEDATKGVSFSAEQSKSPNAKSPVAVSPGAKKANQLPLIENAPLKGFEKDVMPQMSLDTFEQDGETMVDQSGGKARFEEQVEENMEQTPLDTSEKEELDGLMKVDRMTEETEDSDEFGLIDLELFEKFGRGIFVEYAFNDFSEMMESEEPWKRMTIECY